MPEQKVQFSISYSIHIKLIETIFSFYPLFSVVTKFSNTSWNIYKHTFFHFKISYIIYVQIKKLYQFVRI